MIYPLKMRPYYRYDRETPWGGSSLRDYFTKDIPSDKTGESLEASALTGMESIVENGEHAGMRLSEMVALWGASLTGLSNGTFPHVVKLLDARDLLSVQVHPGDEYAMKHHGKPGKSEAWMILACEPGAKIAYGLSKGDGFAEAAEAGALDDYLNWQEVYPGEVYEIPNGLVHALGEGIVAYEIQQNSDLTYRIWDFGRMGIDGKPREFHLQDALNVIRADLHPKKVKGATYIVPGGSVTAFISNDYFELSRLNLSGKMPMKAGRMRILTPLCPCEVTYPEGSVSVGAGETVIIPAALEGAQLVGNGPVMSSAMPDSEALKECLTYRAEDVAGLNVQ